MEFDQVGEWATEASEPVEGLRVDLTEVSMGGNDGLLHRRVLGDRAECSGAIGQ